MTRLSAVCALALLTGPACAGPSSRGGQTSTLPLPHSAAPAAAVAQGAFVTTASGESGEAALAAARELATRHYLGQTPPLPELRAALDAHLHVQALGPAASGPQEARAWVDNLALQALVAEKLAQSPVEPEPNTPLRSADQVQAALRLLDEASRLASWCALYVRTGAEACADDGRVERMREALSQAAQGLTLRLVPEGGSPYKPGQAPYRPLILEAVMGVADTAQGWAQLPLRVQAPDGLLAAQTGITDGQGRWEVPWQRVPHPGDVITAQVDAEALLGATYAPLWRAAPISVKTRPLTWKTARILVVMKSTLHRNDPLLDMARARLLENLNQQLPNATLAFSATSIAKDGHVALTNMGHDVLVQADISWAFASALGGRSVWYEARSTLACVNLWSQETFANAEPSVQEAGIGDKHAAKQAVNKLTVELAKQMASALLAALPDSL